MEEIRFHVLIAAEGRSKRFCPAEKREDVDENEEGLYVDDCPEHSGVDTDFESKVERCDRDDREPAEDEEVGNDKAAVGYDFCQRVSNGVR